MTTVVLATGIEAYALPDLGLPTAEPGRELVDLGTSATDSRVVVVPMTFGRQPSVVADAARSLREVAARSGVQVALAEPFGTTSHLIAQLRTAVRRAQPHDAVLVTSPSIDPFADADLFRIARLVWQYGSSTLVEVAFTGGAEPDIEAGIARCRALGSHNVVQIPASFAVMSVAAVRSIVDRRVHDALHLLSHGDDGLDAGITAEDHHGYAHSHIAADGSVLHHSH